MNEQMAKDIVDRVIGQIFGFQNPLTLEQVQQKFAFDVRLPQQVFDSETNQPTWAQSTNPTKFITLDNSWGKPDGYWLRPTRQLNSLEDILGAWNEINYTTTERQIDSLNIAQCDNIYFSENVFRSQDISNSKNIVFSDSVHNGSEFVVAGQRSQASSFCLRIEDSKQTTNSFGISWSGNITNSFLIHDSKDLSDCMFCSHLTNKRFCIANMQFDEAEYHRIKDMVIRWILTN